MIVHDHKVPMKILEVTKEHTLLSNIIQDHTQCCRIMEDQPTKKYWCFLSKHKIGIIATAMTSILNICIHIAYMVKYDL
jgi:hypothetical protein